MVLYEYLAPAIIFTVIHGAMLAYGVYSFYMERVNIQIRIIAFSLIRVLAFAFRAAIANGNTETNVNVVAQVFMSVGLIALLYTLQWLLASAFKIGESTKMFHGEVLLNLSKIAIRVSRIYLLVTVGLGIYSAVTLAQATSLDEVHTGEEYHVISTSMALGFVTGYAILFVLYLFQLYEAQVEDELLKRTIAFVTLPAVGFMIIKSAYSVTVAAVSFQDYTSTLTGVKAQVIGDDGFYPLAAVCEVIACSFLLAPHRIKALDNELKEVEKALPQEPAQACTFL